VITLANSDQDFFVLDPAVQRVVIGGIRDSHTLVHGLIANICRIIWLRRALREAHAKIILSFIAATNILVILASFGLYSRVIISERNDPARQSFGWIWDCLRRLLYRYADLATANSQGAVESMRGYVPGQKLAVVPNPLFVPARTIPGERVCPTILTVGRLTHQKAYDVLLEGFARISSHAPYWRLVIVGDGDLGETLRAQAEDLGISDRVDWHGRVKDPFAYYTAADIFVLVSRYEGIPNVLLEAMSCGLPVIVSDASPGPLEYVKHGVTGLVVPVDDVPSLVIALERLINDPRLRRRLGDAARARVAECKLPTVLRIWEKVLGLSNNTNSKGNAL
jgi:GalNAc-alpha-(1->4)-GalNAc-alpha-(1->3)-diNAcBac-PP-undecaprenol alpha-1,4-N-acetyl-D-galactosaminyltransferase